MGVSIESLDLSFLQYERDIPSLTCNRNYEGFFLSFLGKTREEICLIKNHSGKEKNLNRLDILRKRMNKYRSYCVFFHPLSMEP